MPRNRLGFISILGEPGSYCPSVYDDIGGDNECYWFKSEFSNLAGIGITCSRVSHGEPIPDPGDADCYILGGSYNSIHDDYSWQRALYVWFDQLLAVNKPLLAICGGHQLVGAYSGADIVHLEAPPVAGTQSVELTQQGHECVLFDNIARPARFHFANSEHVLTQPAGSTLLATHPRIPNAALSYGSNWFSTQFHPEATESTISRCWRKTHPELTQRYSNNHAGRRVIENFLDFAFGS